MLKGTCPICDAELAQPTTLEESEIILCADCKTRLVVEKINPPQVLYAEAPAVEEDWGQ